MQLFSAIEMRTGLLIVLCCYFLWRLRLVHLRLSNRAISPTVITVLLGFAVIVAHLLIAKWLWDFPWADVVTGLPVIAVVALDIGYFYVRCRKYSPPIRDGEFARSFLEPGRADVWVGRDRRPRISTVFTAPIRNGGVAENLDDAAPFCVHIARWPRCKSLAIPIRPRMAQNRCNRTQKKHSMQLPNNRF